MKKRLLLSAVLMTLALLLTVVTATLAWYSAESATVNVNYDEIKVNASDETFGAGNLQIVVTATPQAGVGPTTHDSETVNGSPQPGGVVYYFVDGTLVKTSAVYSLYGKIDFTCKILDEEGNDVTESLTDEHIATLSSRTFTFAISESTSSLRFGTTASFAVNQTNDSVNVTLTFDSYGNAKFTDAYFAVNSSVELDENGKGKEFALTFSN